MNDQFKTRDDLIQEIQALRKEYESLKASFDKDANEHKLIEKKHFEDEQHLFSIYNTVGDVIYQLTVEPDEKYLFTSVNQAFLDVTGLHQEQVVGKLVHEVISEPSIKIVLEKYKQAIDQKRIIRWEETTDYPTGRLTGEVSIAPVFNDDGRCTNLIGSVHDITGLKQKEERLIFITQAIESSSEAIAIYDTHGHYYYCNSAFIELFECSNLEELKNYDASKGVFKDPVIVQEIFENIMFGKSWVGELEMVTKNGVVFPAYGRADALKDKDGKIVGFIGISKDITERKMLEHTLRQSEERYRTLIDNRGEGVCFLNNEEIFIVVNQTAEKIFGVDKGQLTGLCLSDFLFGDNKEIVKNETQKRRQGQISIYEHEIVLKDGIKKDLLITASPCFDSTRFIGTFAIFNDITDRKRAENELQVTLAELKKSQRIAKMGSWKLDIAANIFTASEECLQIWGFPNDSHPEFQEVSQCIHHDDRERASEVLKYSLQTGEPYTVEIRIVRKDSGEIRNILSEGEIQCDFDGKPVTVFGTNQDITERKNLEENYHVLLNGSSVGILAVDLETHRFLFSNPVICKLFGYSDEEFQRLTMEDLVPTESLDLAMSEFASQMMGAKSMSSTIPLQRKDGTVFYADIAGTPIFFKGRKCSVGFFIDITARKQGEDALRSSQLLLKSSIESQNDTFFFSIDRNYRYLLFNRVHSDLMKLVNEKDIKEGMNFLECLSSEEDSKAAREDYNRVFLGESFSRVQVIGDAEPVYYEGFFYPIFNEKNEVIGATTAGRNITERKLAEEKLLAEQNFRKAIELSLTSGIAIVDKEGRQTYVNPSFCGIFGWSEQELIGKTAPYVYWPPEHLQVIHEAFQTTLANNAPKEGFELVFVRKDGVLIPVKVIISPFTNGKEILGWLANVIDISDRKHAEGALLESEENFRSIFENSSAAMAIIEPDTTILLINEEFCKLSGFTRQEVIGTSWIKQIPPEDLERLKEYNRRRLMNPMDAPENYEFSFYHKNGEIRHALMSISMLSNRKSVASFVDITERKLKEDGIRQLSDRLSLAVRAGGVGLWDYDIVKNILLWDDQMLALYGIEKNKFGGAYEAWRAGLHPDDVAQGDKEIQMALRGEKEFDTEFRVLWPDKTVHNIRAIAIIQRDQLGNPLRMIGTNWDISIQKQTEQELIQAKEKA